METPGVYFPCISVRVDLYLHIFITKIHSHMLIKCINTQHLMLGKYHLYLKLKVSVMNVYIYSLIIYCVIEETIEKHDNKSFLAAMPETYLPDS